MVHPSHDHRPAIGTSPKHRWSAQDAPRAQIHRTAAVLPPQCHTPTSAATIQWFGDVFAMPHLHIRHRRCPKNFKGVVKTCDDFLRCPNFPAPSQCGWCAAGRCCCKWGRQLIGKCDHGISNKFRDPMLICLYLQLICSWCYVWHFIYICC